ncbi:MAG: diguanylate cyclase [Acholeplasmatales bacterium]|nr:diguanylate cyclase [Acholeplasmatales bacterium]
MEMKVYLVLATILSLGGILIGLQSFRTEKASGKYLGLASFFSVICMLCYVISALADNETEMAVSTSIYFVFIYFMVFSLFGFVFKFCDYKFKLPFKIIFVVGIISSILEVVVFIINIFNPIALAFNYDATREYAKYAYVLNAFGFVHLALVYVVLISIGIMLVLTAIRVPRHFKNQYLNLIIALILAVAANAFFLFSNVLKLDVSLLLYTVIAAFCYWGAFIYTKRNMITNFKSVVVDEVDLGIVMFDYNNKYLTSNAAVEKYFSAIKFDENLTLKTFTETLGLYLDDNANKATTICYVEREKSIKSLRCDFLRFVDKSNKVEGSLFIIDNEALELDIHTGFYNWDSFLNYIENPNKSFVYPLIIAVVDINSISVINSTHGKQKGDEVIRELASMMKERLPKNTMYVRGSDAHLIALTYNRTSEDISEIMEGIKRDFDTSCQFAVSEAKNENSIIDAIDEATDAMVSKKLLDQESIHSSMLKSLLGALEECDSDTEQHVKRTQDLGHKLGLRLGLSDSEQSNLNLLCILHDIGKIGIPLDILNKPAKLNEDEWALMKSHVEKGYNIAKSSPALEGIAEMIRYHHERWDGKGYPDGLSMESIPLLSRIISVIDAFDAMTHDRIYRKAMSVDAALNELIRCAGGQFDPTIVSEFVAMIKDNNDLYKENNNVEKNSEEVEITHLTSKDKFSKESKGNVFTIPFGNYIADVDNKIISASEGFYTMTGYTKEDIEKGNISQMDLIPEEDRTEYLVQLQTAMSGKTRVLIEHRIKCKDDSTINVLCLGRQYFDNDTKKPLVEIFITNVINTNAVKLLARKEEVKSQKRLNQWESTYRRDSLTNISNHSAFKSDVDLILLKQDKKVLFAMLDIDKFKDVNDNYGHQYGDEVLIFLAQTLQNSIDEDDLLCRMGGDEFAIFMAVDIEMPDEDLEAHISNIHNRVTTTLAATKNGCTISMGAAITTETYNFNKLYGAADKQLYKSKEAGRNRITITKI